MKKTKKIFVSVPMRDRTYEDILKSINVLERVALLSKLYDPTDLDCGIEFVHNFKRRETIDIYDPVPPKVINESVYHLGKAVQKMAECDGFIGVNIGPSYSGCLIENSIANSYGLEMILIDPDDFREFDDTKEYGKEDKNVNN